jgi:predicted Zn-dependent peptidase
LTQTEYKKTVLSNGLRIVTERIPHVRSVALGIWIATGTRDEAEKDNGISHFVEHMVFKGTGRRSAREIAESLESVGGHLNAFTSKEVTCFYAQFLDEHLPIAVDVLSDLVTDPRFDEEEIRKEKQVVLEEINNVEDTPEDLIHERFQRNLFPNHPLGFSTLGTRETVSRFARDDLIRYMRRNYTLDRVVVAASGNVDHHDLINLVGSTLDPLPQVSTREVDPPPATGVNFHIEEASILQAHLCVGTSSFPYEDPRKFALLVLNTLLGGGMSSRLFQTIREEYGLAYTVYSFLDFMLDTGVFGIYVGTDKDKVDACLELIHQELQALRTAPVPAHELERTKSQLKGSLMLALESTSGRMNRLAKMEMYVRSYYTLDDIIKRIDSVSQSDILGVAGELLDRGRLHTTILKPKDGGANGHRRTEGN